ncbi:MAG: hypothetical protein CMJ67_02480 [Planctomycetaceae bacterium]|nr:hypothetical protein [Planctomycetaceae bacterium]
MTSAEVNLADPLAQLIDGTSRLEVKSGTIRDVLAGIAQEHPALRSAVWPGDSGPSPFLAIFVDDEDYRLRGGLDTEVRPGSILRLLPALSGG